MALSRGDVISLGKFAEKLERVSQRHALLNSIIDMIPLSCPGLMKPLKTQILYIPLYLLHVQTKGLLGAHLNILVSFFLRKRKILSSYVTMLVIVILALYDLHITASIIV